LGLEGLGFSGVKKGEESDPGSPGMIVPLGVAGDGCGAAAAGGGGGVWAFGFSAGLA
jgi:hypothetical protein